MSVGPGISYDIVNSAYAAVVILAIYAAYFKGYVVGGAEGSRLWGIALGRFFTILCYLRSPSKKKWGAFLATAGPSG